MKEQMKTQLTYRDFEIWMSENGYHADDDAADKFEVFCEEHDLSEEESEALWYSF